MAFLTKADISAIVTDPQTIASLSQVTVEAPGASTVLAEEMAAGIWGQIDEATELRQRIIAAVVARPTFARNLALRLGGDD